MCELSRWVNGKLLNEPVKALPEIEIKSGKYSSGDISPDYRTKWGVNNSLELAVIYILKGRQRNKAL